jgi:glycosyltransferase involved in cell wall biosynthesis
MPLRISIGILAYNEALSIEKNLLSLLKQDLFNETNPIQAGSEEGNQSKLYGDKIIEIVVVPNGCTDDTAAVAKKTLERLVNKSNFSTLSWRVCEIEKAGKSNAWNLYVHQLSDPAANYLFLMDADIEFLEPHTLSNTIDTLQKNPDAWVCVDKPIKDVALKKKKNLFEQLSALISTSPNNAEPEICGQLYCSRAKKLRKIWLPTDLPSAEDGFVRAMVLTKCFTAPEDFKRIVVAQAASHVFEAYTSINGLLRHEKWLVISSTINAFIYNYLWSNSNQEQDAGFLIKRNNEENPAWLNQLVKAAMLKKGWWVIPHRFLFRRLYRLQNLWQNKPVKSLFLFPVFCIAFCIDLLVFLQVNNELHRKINMVDFGKLNYE